MANPSGNDNIWEHISEYDPNFLNPNAHPEMWKRTVKNQTTEDFWNIKPGGFWGIGNTLPAAQEFENTDYGSEIQPFGYGNPFVPPTINDFLFDNDPPEIPVAGESEQNRVGPKTFENPPSPPLLPFNYGITGTDGALVMNPQTYDSFINISEQSPENVNIGGSHGTYPGQWPLATQNNWAQNSIFPGDNISTNLSCAQKLPQNAQTPVPVAPTEHQVQKSVAHISYHDIYPRRKIEKSKKPVAPADNLISAQLSGAIHTLSQQDISTIIKQSTEILLQPKGSKSRLLSDLERIVEAFLNFNKNHPRKSPETPLQKDATNSEPASDTKKTRPKSSKKKKVSSKICSKCNHISNTHRDHNEHMRRHLKDGEILKCDFCNKLMFDKTKLWMHTTRHSPYICPRKCGMRFACAGLKKAHRCRDHMHMKNMKNPSSEN